MKKRKILYIAVIVILLAIFSFSAFQVGSYYIESKQRNDSYSALAEIVEQARLDAAKASQEGEEEETTPTEEDDGEPEILPEYQQAYEMNPDLIGWLKMEGCCIDYPVMMSDVEPDYYLRRNFEKEYDSGGSIYIRIGDPFEPSDNLTIYGHNMGDGSMFGDLMRYEFKDYVAEHPYIQFDTIYERHTYQIFAVFVTTATVGEGFKYHVAVDFETEEEFNQFISTCKVLSLVRTGVTPVYGDKLICLSTCEYTNVNGRLVVAAVRID